MRLESKDREATEAILREAVTDAVDFIESEISEERVKAQRYFEGECDVGAEQGRSQVVNTKVRDTVRAVMPSLLRVFLSTDKPVEYKPRGREDVKQAEQATHYMTHEFDRIGGFKILRDCFHDALTKKVGIAKVYWDEADETEIFDYNDISDEEYSLIVNSPDIEVVEHEAQYDEMGQGLHTLKVAKTKTRGRLAVTALPPEEFFVDRNAKCIEDAYVTAHRTEMRIMDLIELGYDFDEVWKYVGDANADSVTDYEDYERRGYDQNGDASHLDPAMREIVVTEAYMKIDVDGSGIAQMHKALLLGSQYKLLDIEPWGDVPFVPFEIDPEPHTFFGRSMADILINEQDTGTALLRGLLDNMYMTNNPRLIYVDGMAAPDDVLNHEIAAPIRVKSPDAVSAMAVPFAASATLPAMEYFDQQTELKTGVRRMTNGLDADRLQNTTATAVAAAEQAGEAQIETMARNLAEGGVKRLFRLMLKLTVENVDDETLQELAGPDFQPIDPRSWRTDMDIAVNVGLGTGQEAQRLGTMQQALQLQMQIWQGYGPTNGLVTMTGIRNTIADILALGGVRNADRYFQPMDPQTEQMLLQQASQAAQAQGQPQDQQAQAFIQGEAIKAQAKQQADMMKLQLDAQKARAQEERERTRLAAEDDRARDQMAQDLLVDAAKIYGQYGTAVDVERVRGEQAKPRDEY
jgi:hypothetical protein